MVGRAHPATHVYKTTPVAWWQTMQRQVVWRLKKLYLQKGRSMPDAWMMKPEVAGTTTWAMKTTHSQRSNSSVLLGCLTVRWEIIEAYLGGGIRMPIFKLGKGFAIRERSSTSLATTPSLLRGSTIAPGHNQRRMR